MKVRLYVDRDAAIRAGSETYGSVIAELDLTVLSEEDRAVVASAPERDGVTGLADDPWPFRGPQVLPKPKTASPEPMVWIAWRREVLAAQEAWIIEACKAIETQFEDYLTWAREQPITAFIRWDSRHQAGTTSLPVTFGGMRLPEYPAGVPMARRTFDPSRLAWESLAERLAEAQAEIDRQRELRREQEASRERENIKAAVERQERLAAEVEHMDANAQGRWRLGLLPEEEILDSLRSRLFTRLDGWPRYVKLRNADLDHKDWCEGQGMKCDVVPAASLTAVQYDYFVRLTRDVPETASYSVKRHTCVCETCNAETSRLSILVKIQDGPLVFTREYAILAVTPDAVDEAPGE